LKIAAPHKYVKNNGKGIFPLVMGQ